MARDDAPYVHIGILVNDLEAAIDRYSRLGISFMEPRTVQVDHLVENGRETSLDLTIGGATMSRPLLSRITQEKSRDSRMIVEYPDR